MKLFKSIAAVAALLALNACATISEKMNKPEGVTATECFTAGGTIDTSSGTSMCMMGDGESKPIL